MISLTPELRLVPVQEENAGQVYGIMVACYPPVYAHLWQDAGKWYLQNMYNRQQVIADASNPDSPYFIVEWEESPIGILWYKKHDASPDHPNSPGLKLQRIYLAPSTHGKGIGRLITNFVAEEANRLGKELVWLEAMDTQESAHRFYEKMGYRKAGTYRLTFEHMHPHYRGMVRMTKFLK